VTDWLNRGRNSNSQKEKENPLKPEFLENRLSDGRTLRKSRNEIT
jgi:hypothetical protein